MQTHRLFGVEIRYSEERFPELYPREVVYESDAAEQVARLLSESGGSGRRVAVLMDTRTREVAGRDVARRLASNGWEVDEIVVTDPAPGRTPESDDVTAAGVAARSRDADVIVTVGSGVITDLGKWVSADRGIPFVVFATAASMNGYASANVAAMIEGFKTLHRGHPPCAIAASPKILRDAPYPMTTAGLADLLAKSTSSVDWYLNHLLFGDPYDQGVVDLIAGIEPLYLDHPEAIVAREAGAIAALFQALVLTGVAMTLVGSSAPASGGEHLISHTLDLRSSIDGGPHDLHGRQVGVGTVMMLELYRRVLSLESPRWSLARAEVDREYWGKLSGAIERQIEGKRERMERARATLAKGSAWDDLRAAVRPRLRPTERVRGCLASACGATAAEDLGIDRPRLVEAFLHAQDVRSRFTIVDLAWLAGVLPDAAGEIVE